MEMTIASDTISKTACIFPDAVFCAVFELVLTALSGRVSAMTVFAVGSCAVLMAFSSTVCSMLKRDYVRRENGEYTSIEFKVATLIQ